MIDPVLLKMLCCPETHQHMSEAGPAVVADLNARITAGALKTQSGKVVSEQLDGVLIRNDRQVAYPVRNRIPILLIEEAISL